MTAYYNEYDPVAAAWLRELIKRGLIADGVVDERSIVDVAPEDLQGFTQCHFFAGIGGWSYALRLAGWPDEKPVWTGSPPCQPFSSAGQQKGQDDERHLAPHFAALVAAGRPPILFGEQVASAAVFGKPPKRTVAAPDAEPEWAWIDDLFGRLEAAHYACGTADLPAAGIGAPHIRQRTFFGAVRLADAASFRLWEWQHMGNMEGKTKAQPEYVQIINADSSFDCGDNGGLADADRDGRKAGNRVQPDGTEHDVEHGGGAVRLGDTASGWQWSGVADDGRCGQYEGQDRAAGDAGGLARGGAGKWQTYADWFGICWHPECRDSEARTCDCHTRGAPAGWEWDADDGWVHVGLADASGQRLWGGLGEGDGAAGAAERKARQWQWSRSDHRTGGTDDGLDDAERSSAVHGGWADADWLFCRDGKWRPVEPGTFPLAHGVSARVGRLRGYGNAIVPQAAAAFVTAFTQALGDIE